MSVIICYANMFLPDLELAKLKRLSFYFLDSYLGYLLLLNVILVANLFPVESLLRIYISVGSDLSKLKRLILPSVCLML